AGPCPDIAGIASQSARRSTISELRHVDSALFLSYVGAKRVADCSAAFMRKSARYPLTAVDKFNLYAVFAELASTIYAHSGRAGIIVKAGLITDKLCSAFFSDSLRRMRLCSAIEFEN